MKVAVFGTHSFDREYLHNLNSEFSHELVFFETRLTEETARLAEGFECVCCFVNDCLNAKVLEKLAMLKVGAVVLRSAGYNHVDLKEAARLGVRIMRVPEYSPHSVAEHAVALLMALNRHTHKAYNRVRELDFSLEHLMGFDLFGKTVGVIGTGKIGSAFAKIMKGFGCEVLAFDKKRSPDLETSGTVRYVELEEIYRRSDVISLHIPLLPATKHMIDRDAFAKMKANVFLINTGRGGLIETKALVEALKSRRIGAAGLDVYEEEDGIFYQNLSELGLKDDVLARLLTFPNVLITSHQGFFTHEALTNIARTTLQNVSDFQDGKTLKNEVKEIF